jgi:crotonobetainyl-CoA:carnitine CoA-transferase CaiB-like acyl-CoA transferase
VADGILAGVRVLDMAEGLAGSVAALLLAEAGADVVMIEPPHGSPLRGTAPFAIWNRSKRSLALDLGADRAQLDQLIKGADVLVHDLSFADARARKLDDASLRALAPHLIVCGVTGCPEGHEDEGLPANDAIVLAASGICDEQAAIGRDGPIYLRFPLGSWCAAWLAAIGVVTRIFNVRRGGEAGAVRTSLLQGALLPVMMLWRRVEAPSPALAASFPKKTRPSLAECADGVWIHMMKAPDEAPLMKAAMAALGPEKVKELNEAAGPISPMFPNWGANVAILKTRPSTEWLADLWASDVSVQPAVPMGRLYFDEQAAANEYVIDVDDPHFGRTRQPGHPFSVTPPAALQGPAPQLAADAQDIVKDWSPRAPPSKRGARIKHPLDGVKVVDFGNFLAGPLAPMLMADLGADVIKLESTGGDQMRWAEFAFLACQRNKRGIAAELKDSATREIVEKLVAEADVVHHNLRMPAATRLGLDYESIRKINPRIIYCHVSSYGPRGPRKDWPGYDQLFQASSGWEYEGAGAGNPPMWHRFGMMDHQGALASLYATLLGLLERERTGEGQFVSASLLGASLLTISETLVGPDGELTPYARLDGDQVGVGPGDRLYRTGDGWIVLQAGAAALSAFRDALGAAGLAALEARIASMPGDEVLRTAQAVGADCAPVRLNQGGAFFDNEANRRIGLAVTLPHAKYGKLEQPGAFWTFEGQELAFERAPPLIGEHTREILKSLGLSDAKIAELEAAKAIVSAQA